MSFVHRVDELVEDEGNALIGKAAHWERVPLGKIASVINGFPFPSKGFNNEGHGEPVIRIRDILSGTVGTFFKGSAEGAPRLDHGELVIGMDGDFNCRLWPGESVLMNQRVCKVVVDETIYSTQFLSYALPGYLKLINDHTSAITVKHLSSGTVQEIPLPLPPRPEQDRLVSRLDELFSRIDEGEHALVRVQKLMERYRQSVLKAAVTGELTRDWREKHKGKLESGEALLARILTARREAWEQAELVKMQAKDITPKDDKWKQKYKEPSPPNITNLPELPEGWVWASMDQLLVRIEAGKSFKCEERPPNAGEFGIVKVSAVTWGTYNETESKTITDKSRIQKAYLVREGDFLFSRANTIELVGACVIAGEPKRSLLLSDKILRFIFAFDLRVWVDLLLKSRLGRSQIEELSTGNQESMRNIGQERIGRIVVPLPSLAEIDGIADRVARMQVGADQMLANSYSEGGRCSALRQSILKNAFTGHLLPQDPADEPASALLERIATDRATNITVPKRGRKKKTTA